MFFLNSTGPKQTLRRTSPVASGYFLDDFFRPVSLVEWLVSDGRFTRFYSPRQINPRPKVLPSVHLRSGIPHAPLRSEACVRRFRITFGHGLCRTADVSGACREIQGVFLKRVLCFCFLFDMQSMVCTQC